MHNRLTKKTLDESLKHYGIHELPAEWDGISKFSEAIVKIKSSNGDVYVVATKDESKPQGIKIVRAFHCSSHSSKPLAIYPTLFVEKKEAFVPDLNKPIVILTPEEKEEQKILDRIHSLDIPKLDTKEEKKEWGKEHKVFGYALPHIDNKKLGELIIKHLYKEKFGEKLEYQFKLEYDEYIK